MFTLTYSNTFKNKDDIQETTTNKVLVHSEKAAITLVNNWNTNSKNHSKGRYCYEIISLRSTTTEEMHILDLY